jgi:hypothetical protein
MEKLTGSCMCGSVQYEVEGDLREVIACHCRQCRKSSGHFSAATATRPEHLKLLSSEGLKWYRSSDTAQRGFCGNCGSSLFWKPDHGNHLSIFVGSIDGQTKLTLASHICIKEKGDYYSLKE